MKKISCLLLTLCLLLLAGCGAAEQETVAEKSTYGGAKANVEQIAANVIEAEALVEKVDAIIDWQITESERIIEESRAAREAGEVYTGADTYDQVVEKHTELSGYIKTAGTLREWADALMPIGTEQLDMTYKAAKKYFSETENALLDMESVMQFYFAEYEAAKPLSTFDASQYADEKSRIEAMYYTVEDTVTAFAAIDCPKFMKQTFDRYIKRLEHCNALLNEQYIAVQLEDPLRAYATSYMLVRVDMEFYDYGEQLTKDFNMQYRKVSDRLHGWLDTLGSELKTNCAAIAGAM